jgi:dTDP-4-amino-4,6-dideoxygalactose transaminase
MTAFRQRIAATYDAGLSGVTPPVVREGCSHVYHLYVVRTDRRDWLKEQLAGRGIGTLVHYPLPVHLQDSFAFLGLKEGALPETERAAREVLSLPMHFALTEDDAAHVAATVAEVMA